MIQRASAVNAAAGGGGTAAVTMLSEAPPKGAWIPDGCGRTLKECLWVMRVSPAERFASNARAHRCCPFPSAF